MPIYEVNETAFNVEKCIFFVCFYTNGYKNSTIEHKWTSKFGGYASFIETK